jgi:hypothetical protein
MHGATSGGWEFVVAYAVAAALALSLLAGVGFVVCMQDRGRDSARNDSGKGRGQ